MESYEKGFVVGFLVSVLGQFLKVIGAMVLGALIVFGIIFFMEGCSQVRSFMDDMYEGLPEFQERICGENGAAMFTCPEEDLSSDCMWIRLICGGTEIITKEQKKRMEGIIERRID